MRATLLSIADRLGAAFAIALSASLTFAAWHDISRAWDVWAYHLPFAARIAGIVDASHYVFGPDNAHCFAGFPLLAEALQGLLWRLTGRPEGANFVSLLSLFALVVFVWRFFAVRSYVALLAFLAVPLVQIHATSAYVDLPANVCATILLLIAYQAVVDDSPPSLRRLGAAALVAALAANMKFQLVPIVCAASAVLIWRALRRDHDGTRQRRARILLIALALPVVFATPIKNAVQHQNPVYPVELRIAGMSLPHTEKAYASSPRHLESASSPRRFVHSVLEVGLRPIASGRRWSLDQWTPPDEPGYRMGGFFGAYVFLNILALAVAAVRTRTREARVAAAFVAGTSLLTALLPQCHELRYYLYWMLLLVTMNLVVWARHTRWCAIVATAFLGVVAFSTGGTYLWAGGIGFETLVADKVDATAIARATTGSRLCVSHRPWTFLYAAAFHHGPDYVVVEADRPEDCPSTSPTPTPATSP